VHAEVIAELAVTLLCVEAPDLLAAEVEGREVAAPGEREDKLAVRAGRRRRAIPLAATSNSSLSASLVRKMRSSQTAGVDEPEPGSVAFHNTLFVSLHSAGSPDSRLTAS
jgi:hypothetical protein